MNDVNNRGDEQLSGSASWAVYQCVNGCVHVRFQNVTLTFTGSEFARFAELVGEAFVRLGVRAAVSMAGPH